MKGQRAKGRMVLIGIMLAALFWIVESAVEVLIFNNGSFVGQILTVDPHEIWSRLVAMGIIILFGVYGQFAVTKRERVDKALRASERWLSTTLRSIGDAVIATDTKGRVTLINPVAQSLTGWNGEGAMEKPLEDVFNIINEETGKQADNPVTRVIQEGVVVGLANHTALIAKDGTKRPIDDSGAPIRDDRGNITGVVLVFRDITKRKQAEEALEDSEKKYRSLFEQMLNGLAYCEMLFDENNQPVDFVYLEVNDAFERLTGLKREDVIGRKVTAIFPGIKESYPELFSTYGKVALSGQEAKLDVYFKPLEIWLTISVYSPRKGYFVAVFENITERKQAEKVLQDSEMELFTTLDNVPIVILLVDRERRVQKLNQAAVQFAERPAEEMIGLYGGDALRCLHSFDDPRGCGFGPDCQTCVERLTIMDTLQTGNSHHRVEVSLPFLRGEKQEELTFLLSTVLLTLSKGAVVLVCIEDITERKRMEEEQERLISASQEQNQIIVSMNSELERALNKSRQAEEALRFSDFAFKSIQESVVATDTEYNITHWNEASERIYKIKASEAIGKKLFDVIEIVEASPGDTAERLRQLETRGYYRAEVLHRTKYAELWVTWSIQVIESDGKRNGWVALATDITERRRAEKVIHMMAESTARISDQAFFQDIAHALCEWFRCEVAIVGEIADDSTVRTLAMQADGKIASESSYALRGTPCENVATKGFCYYPENVASLFPEDKGLAQLQLSGYVGVPLLNKRGDTLGVLCAMSREPMKLPEQTEEMMRMFAARAAGEIERRRAEEALRKSEENLRTYLESAPDGVYINDLKGTFLYGNKKAEEITGYKREELVGKSFLKLNLLPAKQLARAGKLLALNAIGRATGPDEIELIRKDGSHIWTEVTTTPIKQEGEVAVVGFIRDITRRKQMEEQLRHSQLLASLGEMTAGIAHEVNNPLASVLLYSELLMASDVPSQTRKDLKVIHEEAQRAAKIMTDLLAYSHKLTTHKRRLNLHSILGKTIKMRRYEQRVHNISVSTNLADGLLYVSGDSSQLMQVFMNLVLNAEEALRKSAGGNIVITTQIDGEWARVSIADDGSGIPQKDLSRVFHPFFTTKEVGEGTGLGLSTCYGIVTAHGGLIRAENNEVGGATFTVELPLSKTRRQGSLPKKQKGRVE